MDHILTKIPEILHRHGPIVMATIIKTQGSTPQVPGASAIFSNDTLLAGTIGGGILEAEVRKLAGEVWTTRESVISEFSLDADIESEEGALCGGSAQILLQYCDPKKQQAFLDLSDSIKDRRPGILVTEINSTSAMPVSVKTSWFHAKRNAEDHWPEHLQSYDQEINRAVKENRMVLLKGIRHQILIQPVNPFPRLVIAGAGHIGKALAHIGNLLDFEVTVIDDRQEYCNKKNIPDAHYLIVQDIGEAIKRDPKTADTYMVIVTRGHRDDAAALRNCIGSGVAYLGMIGSKTKIRLMHRQFIEKGWATPEQLDRVFAPVGLDIQSKTVQEIAISIAAQLVLVKHTKNSLTEMSTVSVIILAAGESTRMGTPKQLLPFGKTSIIETVIHNVQKADVKHITVVLGAHHDIIYDRIKDYKISTMHNRNYRNGMLSSIQAGLKNLPENTNKILILLGDQPMIHTEIINALIDAGRHSEKRIAVAVHKGKWGHPIIIDRKFSQHIQSLAQEKSLRDFLDMHQEEIMEVEMAYPEIHRDIDTIEDYNKELKYRRSL